MHTKSLSKIIFNVMLKFNVILKRLRYFILYFQKYLAYKQLFLYVFLIFSLTLCGGDTPYSGLNLFCAETIDYTKIAVGENDWGTTRFGQEMVSCLPIVSSADKFFPIYAIEVDLKAGDILFAFAEFEVTNDTQVPVMLISQIQLTKDLGFRTPGWIAVTQQNGYNVTPEIHHGARTKIGAVRLTEDFQGFLVLFAQASSNRNSNTSVQVEQGYGQLQYFVY
jgi:hypothetical protein